MNRYWNIKIKTLFPSVTVFVAFALLADFIEVGDRLQVMWDDHVVDNKLSTAAKRLHHPVYAGKVMTWDKPWEGDGSEFPNVVIDTDRDGKRLYRMYYVGWNFTRDILESAKIPDSYSYKIRTCYAESRDGINWMRPELGLVEHEGSKKNNILASFETPTWKYNFFVFKDTNPACRPEERYKAIASGKGSGGHLCVLTSADGIHFKKGWQILKLAPRAVMDDTSLASFWHPKTGKYHVYLRGNRRLKKNERGKMFTDMEMRQVRHAEFADLHCIEASRVIDCVTPDGEASPEYPMYTSCAFPYYRNPDIIVGFPTRYNQRGKWDDNYDLLPDPAHRKLRCKKESRMGLVVTDGLFMVSRDGQNFVRYDEAFFRPGPQRPCSWVYGSCYPGAFVIPTPAADGSGDELSIYKPLGHMTGKGAWLERYTIRMDGFVSRQATFKEQRVVTKDLVFSGDEMLINFSTSGRGRIAVYLYLAGQTKPSLDSCWMFGDRVDSPVTFPKGKLAAFAGKSVRLEFVMSDADLYSFRFKK